jgi:hypothetical protein
MSRFYPFRVAGSEFHLGKKTQKGCSTEHGACRYFKALRPHARGVNSKMKTKIAHSVSGGDIVDHVEFSGSLP